MSAEVSCCRFNSKREKDSVAPSLFELKQQQKNFLAFDV
jgi:hypothetical protein